MRTPELQATTALSVAVSTRKRVLDPVDRFSEVIFGLIMVLTFTGAISVAEGGREQVRQLLVGAVGCNVAWGLVDGVMYVLTSIAERSRRALVLEGIRGAGPEAARAILMAALPEAVAYVTGPEEADRMVERIRTLPPGGGGGWVAWDDVRGAAVSVVLVVLATLPPVIPFLLVEDAGRALRISNAVAVASLFVAGYRLGRATGVKAWLLGAAMVVLGGVLVALTIALGG